MHECSSAECYIERDVAVCRHCGHRGQTVPRQTVESLLRPESLSQLQAGAYFFDTSPDCDVVYFSNESDSYFTKNLRSCAHCREHAERIHRDIDLLQTLPLQQPPDQTWSSIKEELSTFVPSGKVARPEGRRKLFRLIPQRLAIASVLFVLVLAIFAVTRHGARFGGHQWELNLAGYLDIVGAATAAAADSKPNDFPAAPGFFDVTLANAKATLDFPFISPQSLSDGYSLTGVRLYTRDNVRAVQLQYQNEQGALCLFQMPATVQPSFGNQQSEPDTVGGVQCHRTRSSRCVAYRFVLGQTGYVLMMRQRNPGSTDRLIQEIRAAYEKTAGMSRDSKQSERKRSEERVIRRRWMIPAVANCPCGSERGSWA